MNTAAQLNPGSRKRKGERGASLILFTFMTFLVVVPMIGLAIDGAVVFWTKAKLSAAVDAAALAGGRSLSAGADLTSQTNNAIATARGYFAANFPSGMLGTLVVGGQPTVNVAQTGANLRTVTVQATVNVPLYFMRLLNFNMATASDTGQASRRDVNVIIVLDRSGSQASVCQTMKASAQQFVSMFVDGRDELGLITFSTTANVDFVPTTSFNEPGPPYNRSLSDTIAQLGCGGGTNTAMALALALQQLQATSRPGALSVILFYTDGFPSAITASFPYPALIRTVNDTRYLVSNTSTSQDVPADSQCKSSLNGVVMAYSNDTSATGDTLGLYNPSGIPISATGLPPLVTASGCEFYEKQDARYMRDSIAYIPTTDVYGSSTIGYKTVNLDYFPISDPNYGGNGTNIRPDVPRALTDLAYNTADNMAQRIRTDPTYHPIIYCIGYSSSVDPVFMKRVANINDPSNLSYSSTYPSGAYIYAPTADQLSAAFQQIASQVLRLSQ